MQLQVCVLFADTGVIVADYDWGKYNRLLDIGGATGSLLSEIIHRTGVKGVVCDLKQVCF